MTSVTSFNGHVLHTAQDEREQRKQTTQTVATGTAATGTAAYQAKRYAAGNGYLKGMLRNATKTARVVDMNAAEAMSLWQRFKFNSLHFANDAFARLSQLQNNRFLKPIVTSKAMRGLTGAFGVVTAAFVLVTGVNDSIKTGRLAIGDIQDKIGWAA